MPERFQPPIAGSTLPLAPAKLPTDGQWSEDVVASWSQELGRLRRLGFTAVDIVDSWLPFGEVDDRAAAALGSAVAGSGLSIVGLSSIRRSIIDPADGVANLQYTHRAIDVAAQLGAPVLSIGFHRPLTETQQEWGAFWEAPSPSDAPSTFDQAVRLLRELIAHARQVDVSLSLELYEYTLVGSGAAAARLVDAVDDPLLGINADIANVYRVPEPLQETWLDTLTVVLPYMNYWHVKNYRRAASFPAGPFLAWPTQLSDGDINYRLALRLAADAGYAGPICIEHYGGDGLAAQAAGRAYLSGLLEEL